MNKMRKMGPPFPPFVDFTWPVRGVRGDPGWTPPGKKRRDCQQVTYEKVKRRRLSAGKGAVQDKGAIRNESQHAPVASGPGANFGPTRNPKMAPKSHF